MQKKNTEIIDMAKYANVDQVAKLCNCSARHIQNLFKDYNAEGKTTRGKYDLAVFIPWYIEFLRTGQKSEDQKTAKERQEEIKAKNVEFDYMVKIKQFIPVKLFYEILLKEIKEIETNVRGIRKKSIQFLQAQNKTEIERIFDESVNAAFSKYADAIKRESSTKRSTTRRSADNKKPNTKRRTRKNSSGNTTKSKRRAPAKTKTSNKRMGRAK